MQYNPPKFVQQVLHSVAAPVLPEGQEHVGLGDLIHGMTHRAGIKHCSKCAAKKAKANRISFGRPR